MNFIAGSFFDLNQLEELIQRTAWRLVRAAEDKMGNEKGAEKRVWAIQQLMIEYPELQQHNFKAESYIRAAYINFKTETSYA